ncbi:hypothetical protein KJI95_11335 [Shewanella sp. JM162201]|uniref:Uncharacterized protein n=1 Tax=Shewanella jiangmenensis TaxID=2837387 RepID=A0ABS5V3T9_9GAMM|nr:hypothetical protein [Shewanella jiangmenensis]MBT1445113.1 hypothetical protein [Shewanella jiangmenensis]
MSRLAAFWPLWCRDVGSASFLGMAAVFLGLILPLGLLLGRADEVGFMLAFANIGLCCAIAWQHNRLHAAEWTLVNPGFTELVRSHSRALLAFAALLSLLCWQFFGIPLGYGALSMLLGGGFLYLCYLRPGSFYLSMAAFFAIVLIDPLLEQLPWLNWLAPVVAIALWYWLDSKLWRGPWRQEAVTLYCTGMTTGGLHLPGWSWLSITRHLDAKLFPLSYFGGPAVNAVLLFMPLLVLVASLALKAKGSEISYLHLWVQFTVMMSSMVHWTRCMRWRSLDSLLVLPLFSGWNDFCERMFGAQFKLLLLTVVSMVFSALIAVLVFELPLWIWPVAVLATAWGAGFSLAFGVFCKNTVHTTALMMLMILPLVTVDVALRFAKEGSANPPLWLGINGLLALLALASMYWTRFKLPRG